MHKAGQVQEAAQFHLIRAQWDLDLDLDLILHQIFKPKKINLLWALAQALIRNQGLGLKQIKNPKRTLLAQAHLWVLAQAQWTPAQVPGLAPVLAQAQLPLK